MLMLVAAGCCHATLCVHAPVCFVQIAGADTLSVIALPSSSRLIGRINCSRSKGQSAGRYRLDHHTSG